MTFVSALKFLKNKNYKGQIKVNNIYNLCVK